MDCKDRCDKHTQELILPHQNHTMSSTPTLGGDGVTSHLHNNGPPDQDRRYRNSGGPAEDNRPKPGGLPAEDNYLKPGELVSIKQNKKMTTVPTQTPPRTAARRTSANTTKV